MTPELSASGFSKNNSSPPDFEYIERGFRWIRETILLIYEHHRHPLPMVALIFMYADTLGKPLAREQGRDEKINEKVSLFVEQYLPGLWDSLEGHPDPKRLLGDTYRNGLVHQMFMKNGHGIHEDKDDPRYVITDETDTPLSINIDRLVPRFLDGLESYRKRLESDNEFRQLFHVCMMETSRTPSKE